MGLRSLKHSSIDHLPVCIGNYPIARDRLVETLLIHDITITSSLLHFTFISPFTTVSCRFSPLLCCTGVLGCLDCVFRVVILCLTRHVASRLPKRCLPRSAFCCGSDVVWLWDTAGANGDGWECLDFAWRAFSVISVFIFRFSFWNCAEVLKLPVVLRKWCNVVVCVHT